MGVFPIQTYGLLTYMIFQVVDYKRFSARGLVFKNQKKALLDFLGGRCD